MQLTWNSSVFPTPMLTLLCINLKHLNISEASEHNELIQRMVKCESLIQSLKCIDKTHVRISEMFTPDIDFDTIIFLKYVCILTLLPYQSDIKSVQMSSMCRG